jgi:hypothetical protein
MVVKVNLWPQLNGQVEGISTHNQVEPNQQQAIIIISLILVANSWTLDRSS